MGDAIVQTITSSPHAKDILFVSLIVGETDANIIARDALAGGAAGSPFAALLRLLRTATKLPQLRLALQVFVGAGGGDAIDLLQANESEAANGPGVDVYCAVVHDYRYIDKVIEEQIRFAQ